MNEEKIISDFIKMAERDELINFNCFDENKREVCVRCGRPVVEDYELCKKCLKKEEERLYG